MKRPALTFAMLASIMTILFFFLVNSLTSSSHIWFIYPAFAVIWWPTSLYYSDKKNFKEYSVASAILTIAFLAATNYITSPFHPWFLYAAFPVIWWPISMYAGKFAKTVKYALIASLCTTAYYSLLNMLLTPWYPWAIYPAYVVLWWPISLFYSYRKKFFELAVAGSILTIAFFIVVNIVSSPFTIWAVYPAFAIAWWPLSMYYFSYRRKKII